MKRDFLINNKRMVIPAIVAVWIFIIFYNFIGFGHSGRSAEKDKNIQKRSTSMREANVIMLDLLDRKPAPYKGVGKDIFTQYEPPAPKPKAVVIAPPPPPPPAPRQPSRLEVFATDVRFMGFLEKELVRTVFVSKGSETYILKKGDKIDDKFIVQDLTETTLIIKDVSADEEFRVELRAGK